MDLVFVLACALLLALERLAYLWAWTRPEHFANWTRRSAWLFPSDPVLALRRLFVVFKAIQVGVLIAWCAWFSGGFPVPTAPFGALLAGAGLVVVGQFLNFSVMRALGTEGVFYGNRFGRKVDWVSGFPFCIVPHPQYLGALLSVWGVLLAMRYPNPDWIVLPLISSVYYALGAHLER